MLNDEMTTRFREAAAKIAEDIVAMVPLNRREVATQKIAELLNLFADYSREVTEYAVVETKRMIVKAIQERLRSERG